MLLGGHTQFVSSQHCQICHSTHPRSKGYLVSFNSLPLPRQTLPPKSSSRCIYLQKLAINSQRHSSGVIAGSWHMYTVISVTTADCFSELLWTHLQCVRVLISTCPCQYLLLLTFLSTVAFWRYKVLQRVDHFSEFPTSCWFAGVFCVSYLWVICYF